MATPIIKTPIYFNPNTPDQYMDSGGESTSFIEFPQSYAIGGYKYTKGDLSPFKNGAIGILGEGGAENTSQVYNNISVNYRAVLPVYGYYSGGQFRTNLIASKSSGTLGRLREDELQPYIRDSQDSNLLYVMLSPSNSDPGMYITLAQYDREKQKMNWRIYLSQPNDNTVNYLYQDDANLYFLTPMIYSPRHRTEEFNNKAYIVSVRKSDGYLKEVFGIDLFTFGATTDQREHGQIFYKYLGFINQDEFLLELTQNHESFDTVQNDMFVSDFNNFNAQSNWESYHMHKYTIKINVFKYIASVIQDIDCGIAPGVAYNNNITYAVRNYSVFGTNILDDMGRRQFVPISSYVSTDIQNSQGQVINAESLYQYTWNADHTAVTGIVKLKVFDNRNRHNIIIGGARGVNYQTILDRYNPITTNYPYRLEPVWVSRSTYDYIDTSKGNFDRSNEAEAKVFRELFREGEYYTDLASNENYFDYSNRSANYRVPYYRRYDIVKTTRNVPVLRINCMEFLAKRKSLYIDGTELKYGPAPLQRAVYGSSVYYSAASDLHNDVKLHNERLLSTGLDVFYSQANDYPSNDTSYSYNNYIFGSTYGYGRESNSSDSLERQLPVVLEFRRAYDNLADNGILKDGAPMPIFAKGYAINVFDNDGYPPTSWVVEGLDVKTNTWKQLDKVDDYTMCQQIDANNAELVQTDWKPWLFDREFPYSTSLKKWNFLKQRRNFFAFENFREICPNGVKSIKITFTKGIGDYQYITFSNVSIIEERRDEYEPCVPSMRYRPRNDNNRSDTQVTTTTTNFVDAAYHSNSYTNMLHHCFYDELPGYQAGEIPSFDAEYMGNLFHASAQSSSESRITMRFHNNLGLVIDGIQVGFDNNYWDNRGFPVEWKIQAQDMQGNWFTLIDVTKNMMKKVNPEYLPTMTEEVFTLVPMVNKLIDNYNTTMQKYYEENELGEYTDLEHVPVFKSTNFYSVYYDNADITHSFSDYDYDGIKELFITAINTMITNLTELELGDNLEQIVAEEDFEDKVDDDEYEYVDPTKFVTKANAVLTVLKNTCQEIGITIDDWNFYNGTSIGYIEEEDKDNYPDLVSYMQDFAGFAEEEWLTKDEEGNELEHIDDDKEFAFMPNYISGDLSERIRPRGKTFIFTFKRPYYVQQLRLVWPSGTGWYYMTGYDSGIVYHGPSASNEANKNWWVDSFIPIRRRVEKLDGMVSAVALSNDRRNNNDNQQYYMNKAVEAVDEVYEDGTTESTNLQNVVWLDQYWTWHNRYYKNEDPSHIGFTATNLPRLIFRVNAESYSANPATPEYFKHAFGNDFANVLGGSSYGKRLKLTAYEVVSQLYTSKGLEWNESPIEWKLYGSNDQFNWVELDHTTFKWQEFLQKTKMCLIKNPGYYAYYKFEVLNTYQTYKLKENGNFIENQTYYCRMYGINTYFENPTTDLNNRYDVPVYSYYWNAEKEDWNTKVSLVKGSTKRDDISLFTQFNTDLPVFNAWYEDDKVEIEYDFDQYNEGCKPYIDRLHLALNSSMEENELPVHVKIYGKNDPIAAYTEDDLIHEENNIAWSQDPTPYEHDFIFNEAKNLRFYKIVFDLNENAKNTTFNENWIVLSDMRRENDEFIDGDDLTIESEDRARQLLFKLKVDHYLTLCDCQLKNVYGNMWLGDNEWAQVCAHNVYINQVDPVEQKFKTKRSISAIGACINAAHLDSNKNIWIWGNSSPLYTPEAALDTAKDNYCYIAIQPAYGELAVRIEPETHYKTYDGEAADTFVKVWIENTLNGDKVGGKMKITIDGSDAVFSNNNSQEIQVETTNAEPVSTLQIHTDNPSRINVSVYMIRD